ncbi:MAG: hypothetical protein WB217_15195 [Mesobacillus sp.]
MDRKKESTTKDAEAKLYGLDKELSLQSVNFATTENPLLNEHIRDDKYEE